MAVKLPLPEIVAELLNSFAVILLLLVSVPPVIETIFWEIVPLLVPPLEIINEPVLPVMLLELFKLPALIVPLLVTEPWLIKDSAVISFPLLLINSLPVSFVIVDAIIEPLLVNVPLLSIVPLSDEEPMLPLFMNLSLLIISSEIILLP